MQHRGHIIVIGNAKGGSGKSTTAMHVITRLLAIGHRVAAIDLDGRQQSLGRYIENRQVLVEKRGVKLAVPAIHVIAPSDDAARTYADLCATLEGVLPTHDFVVLDCPGSDNAAARLAHSFADTLLTPVNDSFVDVDLLAYINADTYEMIEPSWYSEMIWDMRKKRFIKDGHRIDWVVMRNRLSHSEARNKRHVGQVLDALAPRLAFRHVHGLGERVIFRELFLKGLTLSDLRTPGLGVELTMNHVAAHQEVRDLVQALRLPKPRAADTEADVAADTGDTDAPASYAAALNTEIQSSL